jgi:hypothetical protein
MNPVKYEPVVTAGTVTGVIVAVAAIVLPSIDAGTWETAVAAVLPIIAAIVARFKVTPVAKPPIDDQRASVKK